MGTMSEPARPTMSSDNWDRRPHMSSATAALFTQFISCNLKYFQVRLTNLHHTRVWKYTLDSARTEKEGKKMQLEKTTKP
jgi:hypothetical protein